MLVLKPIEFGYRISTVGLELTYTDSADAKIKVEALPIMGESTENYTSIEIHFSTVAEAKCITVNFYEMNYKGFAILEESETANGLTGFYEVMDSVYLQENIAKYDPKKRLGLKHYIVTGYDGYVELLASEYAVNIGDITK